MFSLKFLSRYRSFFQTYKNTTLFTDNQALAVILQSEGEVKRVKSKDRFVRQYILKAISLYHSLSQALHLSIHWISNKSNSEADFLSRLPIASYN